MNRLLGRCVTALAAVAALCVAIVPPVATAADTGVAASYYRIWSLRSHRCMDVAREQTGNNIPVIQWTCSGKHNQQWEFRSSGGYYQIVARHSGKCLEPKYASQKNEDLVQYSCSSRTSQQWRLEDAGGGYRRLVNRYSGRCADVENNQTGDGVHILQYTCNGQNNQRWKLIAAG